MRRWPRCRDSLTTLPLFPRRGWLRSTRRQSMRSLGESTIRGAGLTSSRSGAAAGTTEAEGILGTRFLPLSDRAQLTSTLRTTRNTLWLFMRLLSISCLMKRATSHLQSKYSYSMPQCCMTSVITSIPRLIITSLRTSFWSLRNVLGCQMTSFT